MANKKDKKKKDREKRVAQKKIAAAAKRREQEKAADEPKKGVTSRTKTMTSAVAKPTRVAATNKKSTFTQRRTGG